MKRIVLAVAATAALAAAPAWAQMGPGGMGPGMMGGYGQGYGPGYGMGPGMMGGMMGPGMMGGMMGGFGQGMGPGMMWGYGALDLTDEQRARIAEIQQDVSRKQWELMGKVHEQMFQTMLDARKRMDAVLTREQREQLKRRWGTR